MDALYKFLRGSGLQKDFTIEEWDVSKSQKKYLILCSKMLSDSTAYQQLRVVAPNDKSRPAKLNALINVMKYLAINYVKVDDVMMNCVWDGQFQLTNTVTEDGKIKALEYTINFKYKEEKIYD